MDNVARRLSVAILGLLILLGSQPPSARADANCNCLLAYNTSSSTSNPVAPNSSIIKSQVVEGKLPSSAVPLERAINCLGVKLESISKPREGAIESNVTLKNTAIQPLCIHFPRGQVLLADGKSQDQVIVNDTYQCIPAGATVDVVVPTLCASDPQTPPPSANGSPYSVRTLPPSETPLEILRGMTMLEYRIRSANGEYNQLPKTASGPNAVLQWALYFARADELNQKRPTLEYMQSVAYEQSPELKSLPPEKKADVDEQLSRIFKAAIDLADAVRQVAQIYPPYLQGKKDAAAYQQWLATSTPEERSRVVYTDLDQLVNCMGAPIEVTGSPERSPAYVNLTSTNPTGIPMWLRERQNTLFSPQGEDRQRMMSTTGRWRYLPPHQRVSSYEPSMCYDLRSLKTPPAPGESALRYTVNNVPPHLVPPYHVLAPYTNYIVTRSRALNIPYNNVPPTSIPAMSPPQYHAPDVHPYSGHQYLPQWVASHTYSTYPAGPDQVDRYSLSPPNSPTSNTPSTSPYPLNPADRVTPDTMKKVILPQVPEQYRTKAEPLVNEMFKYVDGATKATFDIAKTDPAYKNAQDYANMYAEADPPKEKNGPVTDIPRDGKVKQARPFPKPPAKPPLAGNPTPTVSDSYAQAGPGGKTQPPPSATPRTPVNLSLEDRLAGLSRMADLYKKGYDGRHPPPPPPAGEVNDSAAKRYTLDRRNAIPILEQMRDLLARARKDREPRFAAILEEMGDLRQDLGDNLGAKKDYEQALPIREAHAKEKKTEQLEELLSRLASVHRAMGEKGKALALDERRVKLMEARDAKYTTAAMGSLGLAYWHNNDRKSAIRWGEKIIEREKAAGRDHFNIPYNYFGGDREHPWPLSSVHRHLGKAYMEINDLQKSQQHLEEGLKHALKNNSGRENLFLADYLEALGDLYQRQNEHKKAEYMYRRYLAVEKSWLDQIDVPGKDGDFKHPDLEATKARLCQATGKLIKSLEAMGKHTEAQKVKESTPHLAPSDEKSGEGEQPSNEQ